MSRVRIVFVLAVLASAPVAPGAWAQASGPAQPIDGFYVGVGAGLDFPQSSRAAVDGPGSGPRMNDPIGWNAGAVASGSVGVGVGNGLRLELQGDYHHSDHGSGGGDRSAAGVMVNALYDIDVGLAWMMPYVGMGGGWQFVSWHAVGLPGSGGTVVAGQTHAALAYQAMLGAAFPLAAVPGLAMTAEYRYLDIPGTRGYRASSRLGPARVHAGGDADHAVLLGLRYAFGDDDGLPDLTPAAAPPLAVPAAPEVMPARTYLVFFDWDRADLTPRAREIIAEAVRNSAHIPHTRIEVTGHADSTGTARANQLLSLKRAEVVEAELLRQGIPAAVIDLHGVGDTRPLAPTPAGVREPRNRVVEIVYR